MLSLIAAMSENRIIGRNGHLPWHLPRDLKFFKEKTIGHSIIMGRKTFESINSKPLPKRKNIILSKQTDFNAEGCFVVSNLEDACKMSESSETFIIGGESIYREAIHFADRLYITLVHCQLEGDAIFPEFLSERWIESSVSHFEADDANEYALTFYTYDKT